MAELNASFAELMHDTADELVLFDPDLAARFYHAADLVRIESDHLRKIIPRQAMANIILMFVGVLIGFGFHWLLTGL